MKVKQTAGRKELGQFTPQFAALNDDVLFGEVWSGDEISLRERSIINVIALMAQGLVDASFKYHLENAKNNGITREEIAAILTHAAFYAGWPKAWAAFRMAVEVWNASDSSSEKAAHAAQMVFRSEMPTVNLQSILSVKVIWPRFPFGKFRSSM